MENKELNNFIKDKMLEIVRAIKAVDPVADYISLAFIDNEMIMFNNNYFEKEEDPNALKINADYYEKDFALKEFGALNPTLEDINTFTI